jgi:hypothetical protein
MFNNLKMTTTTNKNIIAIISLTNILESTVGFLVMLVILSSLRFAINHL